MDNLLNNKAAMLGLSVLAFLVAAVLVITIFRMLFGGRLRMPGGRARQARLGIVDAFDLDRQRQLIIVRRDNIEHLIMIGGPNDVVIESEIVRAEGRDLTRREPTAAEPARIPAPPPAFDKPAAPAPEKPPVSAPRTPPLDVRVPPAPAALDIAPEPARAPTFPLPPRRPAPTPPLAAERRPPTPKLPDAVSRGDEIPALTGQPPAPAPAPPAPTLSPAPAARVPAPPPPPAPAQPAQPPRPPFLKPLGQRPPPAAPTAARPQPRVGAPGGAPPAPPPMTASRAAPPTQPASGQGDALESLEEEMAKLLGRGP